MSFVIAAQHPVSPAGLIRREIVNPCLSILQVALGVLLAELALAIVSAFRRPARLPWRRWPGRRSFRRSAW
jgi:hypothetical protein